MNQLERLWEYQLADVEVDNLELSIRRSPKRQKLVKLRDAYQDLQKDLKGIEDEVLAMLDRMDALKDAIALEDQMRQPQARIQEEPPADSAAVQIFIEEATRLSATLQDYEQETRRIRRYAADRDRRQRDVKLRLISTRDEFIPLREEYDAEYKEKQAEVERLKAIVKQKEEGLDPEYLKKYNTIKQHANPPLAKLLNDQCGGCNMSFPSSVLTAVRAGKPVECEHAGAW